MPRTRQQVHEELPLRQHRAAGDGVAVTHGSLELGQANIRES